MRVLTDHIVPKAACNKVIACDEPFPDSGASHKYEISDEAHEHQDGDDVLCSIRFQLGTIQEEGVNGVQNEDLLAIVIDRLRGFQAGPYYKCRENAIALTKLEEALMWLQKRTARRVARGVEGTHQV